jgi:hypothetical protein
MEKQLESKFSAQHNMQRAFHYSKSVIGYGIALIIFTILFGLSFNPALKFVSVTSAKAALVFVFLIAGTIQIYLFERRFPFPEPASYLAKLFLAFLWSLMVALVLFIIYLFVDRGMLAIACIAGSAFFLPSLISQTWTAWYQIPSKEYKLWYPSEISDERVSIFLNSIPIHLKLSTRSDGLVEEIFDVTAPGQTAFGRVFNQFLKQQDKGAQAPIEYADEKNFFGWEFFVEQFGGSIKRRIDPNLSSRENKIKDDSIITAKRYKTAQQFLADKE